MRSVEISVSVPEGQTERTWTIHIYRPSNYVPTWEAYTPVHAARFDLPHYCGEVTVSAWTLDRAKRAAINYFKAIHTKGSK